MTFSHLFIALHVMALAGLAVYGAHRVHLVLLYHLRGPKIREPGAEFDSLPVVTVQCPVYNEKFVVERLIDAVCAMDYPRERLEIQILDDSTDETVELARARVEHHRARGVDVHHMRRDGREGYKAGALEEGLRRAKGEFVAVFDADFVPPQDFVRRTVHHFTDPGVGMVQARWGHLNRTSSMLTEVQAVLLDAHFLIEHGARNRAGRFFNFNGTAGIWRRACIDEAGGWEHDTLTEDLDISYRAQMKGWRFLFLPDLVVPAELPPDVSAFKAQQHRWAKGSIQTALKILPRLWRSDFPFAVKAEATLHLTNNCAYVLLLVLLLTVPAILGLEGVWRGLPVYLGFPFFLAATGTVAFFYAFSQRVGGGGWARSLLMIPMILATGIGMSVNGVRAVFGGLFGGPSEFVRTPKRGDVPAAAAAAAAAAGAAGAAAAAAEATGADVAPSRRMQSYPLVRNLLPVLELAIGAGYLLVMATALRHYGVPALLFPALVAWGFLQVGLLTLADLRPRLAR